MARVFTTRFVFNHQIHDAIVTLLSSNGQRTVLVRLMDPELAELLPDGVLRYEGEEGYKSLHHDNRLVQTLLESVAVAIGNHLVNKD